MKTKDQIINELKNAPSNSAWKRGVVAMAIDLVYCCESDEVTKESMLNGARNWNEYSYGGSGLIYDGEIAESLCTPSTLKRTDNGRLQPNKAETWLDVQSRALSQACRLVLKHNGE